MRAGKLDRRVRIERETVTRDDHGGQVQAWELVATVWAQVVPLRGQALVQSAQLMPGVETKFVMRWREGVTAADRLVYDGENYQILHLAEIGRREGLEILAKLP